MSKANISTLNDDKPFLQTLKHFVADVAIVQYVSVFFVDESREVFLSLFGVAVGLPNVLNQRLGCVIEVSAQLALNFTRYVSLLDEIASLSLKSLAIHLDNEIQELRRIYLCKSTSYEKGLINNGM